jgi:hypothetical protein
MITTPEFDRRPLTPVNGHSVAERKVAARAGVIGGAVVAIVLPDGPAFAVLTTRAVRMSNPRGLAVRLLIQEQFRGSQTRRRLGLAHHSAVLLTPTGKKVVGGSYNTWVPQYCGGLCDEISHAPQT